MKFRRYHRDEGYTMTNRRIAAFHRKQKNERARYPLFSDEIESAQHSVEEEALRREQQHAASIRSMRDFRAAQWRRGRALYFAQPEHIKAIIREKWNAYTGQHDSTYFCCFVDVHSGEQARRLAAIAIEDAKRRERIFAGLNGATTAALL